MKNVLCTKRFPAVLEQVTGTAARRAYRSFRTVPPAHTPMRFRSLPLTAALLLAGSSLAQFDLRFDPSVPVVRNGNALPKAWWGGLDAPQFSNIDLNGDGVKDLFVFDRSGSKVLTLLRQPGHNPSDYVLTHDYDHVAPFNNLKEWALLRDYNCDGKEDLFTAVVGESGMAVYKNTSTNGELSFELVKGLVGAEYPPFSPNLYIPSTDLPGIVDIDGDGDLDVLTFSILGSYIDYLKNMSMETYGTCDSLVYVRRSVCWGYFYENSLNNSVTLDHICSFNVPNPENPLAPDELQALVEAARDGGEPARDAIAGLKAAHAGSSLTPLDLDGNGVMDLILGDIGADNLVALTNGGAVDSAHMASQDVLYPSYDVPVDITIFPAAYHVDVDNDGVRDMLVAPNFPGGSNNTDGLWYYRNISTGPGVVLSQQLEGYLQNEMFDAGEASKPVLFDHNGDGLMDLVVANYGYFVQTSVYSPRLALLENTGTAAAPAFTLVTDNYMGLDASGIGVGMYPTFGDLDGDGRQDMLVGDDLGTIHYFRNISTNAVADFQLTQAVIQTNDGQPLDVGRRATPLLHDLDDDGLLDLIVGERNGNLNHYRNVGTAQQAIWQFVTDSLGHVDVREAYYVTGYSVPFIYRDAEGHRQLLCGSEQGWIFHYGNIEGNLAGAWDLVDPHWQDLRDGGHSGVVLHDLRNSGHPDAITGNLRGGLSYWRNDFATTVHDLVAGGEANAFSIVPNPATDQAELVLHEAPSPGLRFELVDPQGRVVRSVPVRMMRSRVDLTGLAAGPYLVRLLGGSAPAVQRLVLTAR